MNGVLDKGSGGFLGRDTQVQDGNFLVGLGGGGRDLAGNFCRGLAAHSIYTP